MIHLSLANTQTFSYFGIWLDSFWKQNKLFHLVNYLCFAWRFFWFICRFATSWLRGFVASRFCWLARWLAIYWLATGCFGRNRFRFNFYILLLFYVIFTWFVVAPKLPKYSVFFFKWGKCIAKFNPLNIDTNQSSISCLFIGLRRQYCFPIKKKTY